MDILNRKKLVYLKTLTEVEEYNSFGADITDKDGYIVNINFDEFEVGELLAVIEDRAVLYSCCGMVVDRDIMICPACKEHV